MKPVMQTVLGRDGNCLAACIASLFHLSIEEVPNFVGETVGDDWATPVRAWLRPRGYGFFTIGLNGDSSVLNELEGHVIVAGESERGLCHATIWKAGRLVHDPHPSQCGIREPQYVEVIYPLDPAAPLLVSTSNLSSARDAHVHEKSPTNIPPMFAGYRWRWAGQGYIISHDGTDLSGEDAIFTLALAAARGVHGGQRP